MIRLIRNIIIFSTLLAFAGCADYFVTDVDYEKPADTGGTIVSLRIHRPGDDDLAASRSPYGGAYGGGFEPANQWSPMLSGINYDYQIQDLCLFLLDTGGLSVVDYLNSCAPTAQFAGAYYVPDLILDAEDEVDDGHAEHPIDKRYSYARINVGKLEIDPVNNRIIVVANVGDITAECPTVGHLLRHVAARGYSLGEQGSIYIDCPDAQHITASVNAPRHFAMALYEEPSIIQLNKGTYSDPHTASVTLERISARVDFKLTTAPSLLSQQHDPFAPIPYDVRGAEGTVLSRNWISHVRLVNAAAQPSYVLRRTADNARGESLRYLGFETADAEGITTNYVIDPYTADKAKAPATYYGTTALAEASTTEFSTAERVVSRRPFLPIGDADCIGTASAFSFDATGTHGSYFIVGYPQENTLGPAQMLRQYATGILCRSVYEPATVWRLNDAKTAIEAETVTLTTDVLSDDTTPDGGHKSSHYGQTFWMLEELVPRPTESNRIYFHAATDDDAALAARKYVEEHPGVGYTNLQKFVDGVAYNYYWIRHSNSQGTGHPFSPMEYSVVRNNIYRVAITSVSGPGAPSTDPALDNPDRILPITYVHKWHPYTVEEVGM